MEASHTESSVHCTKCFVGPETTVYGIGDPYSTNRGIRLSAFDITSSLNTGVSISCCLVSRFSYPTARWEVGSDLTGTRTWTVVPPLGLD